MSTLSDGLGPQNPTEPAQGQTDTPPSAPQTGDVLPIESAPRATWLFKKGNKWAHEGAVIKHEIRARHQGRMERYVQEQTLSGQKLLDFWLRLLYGIPFKMKRHQLLDLTPDQMAVAQGVATREQKLAARKQRRFIITKFEYHPTMEDMKEANKILMERGFGRAPEIVKVDAGEGGGFRLVYRRWPIGTDPAEGPPPGDRERIIETKALKAKPNGSNGHANGGSNGHS